MVELKHLNKYLLKYKFKIIIGIFITIIARIFALVAPNLIGDSITLIENYLFSSDIELVIVKKKLLQLIEKLEFYFELVKVHLTTITPKNVVKVI